MNKDKIKLTKENAFLIIGHKQYYHVIQNPAGAIIGADWSKDALEEFLKDADIELAGETAVRMKHGLCATNKNRRIFIETPDRFELTL